MSEKKVYEFGNITVETEGPSKEEIKEKAEEYLQFANATAGLCVGKRGAIPAMPSIDEVMASLQRKDGTGQE